jgi:membrane-bound lytic murein transglycosylase D
MNVQRAGSRLALTLAACALLAACAVAPPKPAPRPATVIARPEPSPPTLAPLPPPATGAGFWIDLKASFALDDCADSPQVKAKIAMYTRWPAHFERLLRSSLPLMMYVQKHLQTAGIPGEFVMLPMLESSYNPREPSRHGDPAGMWQLMPRTARGHGIVVNRHYDGRLDPVASTRVAIEMLTAFGEKFGDWRLADMAYNAGPYALLGALRRDPDIGDGAIPDLLGSTTRKHLAKLLALSCILREPQRFHVELPQPDPNDELATIRVPAGTRLAAVAGMAEIPQAKLRALNPGYLGASIPADSPRTLLLPAASAQALATALTIDSSESVAQVDTKPPHGGPGRANSILKCNTRPNEAAQVRGSLRPVAGACDQAPPRTRGRNPVVDRATPSRERRRPETLEQPARRHHSARRAVAHKGLKQGSATVPDRGFAESRAKPISRSRLRRNGHRNAIHGAELRS